MPSLYVLENDQQISRVSLPTGTITLGRLKSNTIVLDNPGVSRHHLRIDGDPSATQFILEDLNSLNGTFMGAKRVQAIYLQNGDEINLGKHTLVFEDN